MKEEELTEVTSVRTVKRATGKYNVDDVSLPLTHLLSKVKNCYKKKCDFPGNAAQITIIQFPIREGEINDPHRNSFLSLIFLSNYNVQFLSLSPER